MCATPQFPTPQFRVRPIPEKHRLHQMPGSGQILYSQLSGASSREVREGHICAVVPVLESKSGSAHVAAGDLEARERCASVAVGIWASKTEAAHVAVRDLASGERSTSVAVGVLESGTRATHVAAGDGRSGSQALGASRRRGLSRRASSALTESTRPARTPAGFRCMHVPQPLRRAGRSGQ
jgi:hypothetical protein